MRDVKGKKCGLMNLYSNCNIFMKKLETIHKYILIYMSVTNYDSNKQFMKYIQDHIENTKMFIILVDFNGHMFRTTRMNKK